MAETVLSWAGLGEAIDRYNKLGELQTAIKGHIDAIAGIFSEMSRVAAGDATPVKRGPGRPPGPSRLGTAVLARAIAPAPIAAGKRGRKPRAERGALRKMIHTLLAGGKILRTVELQQLLPKLGYVGSSDSKIFYNTVYLALKNDPNVVKVGKKFRLRSGAKA